MNLEAIVRIQYMAHYDTKIQTILGYLLVLIHQKHLFVIMYAPTEIWPGIFFFVCVLVFVFCQKFCAKYLDGFDRYSLVCFIFAWRLAVRLPLNMDQKTHSCVRY